MSAEYDFDATVDRRHSGSYKWDTTAHDILPLWVADMDFKTAPCIIEALRRRVEHGVFGYTYVPQEYYRAVTNRFARRHGWTIDPAHIIYTSGVVPAVSAIIKGLTVAGEKIIVQTPAYNCFFSSIRNNGCTLAANRLIADDKGYYTIDFDDLERQASQPDCRLMILCNPHNPTGRLWQHAELERIAEICLRHDIFVIADEIHCELTAPGSEYVPWATVDPRMANRSAICISPSKAFNIAGLQIANIVAPDEKIRRLIDRAINDNEVCDVNPFGVEATIAAYTSGSEWLDDLRRYIRGNYLFAREYLGQHLPQAIISPLEATYLMWIDLTAWELNDSEIESRLEENGVRLSPGPIYGAGGEHHVRMNIACPRKTLHEALRRIVKALGMK